MSYNITNNVANTTYDIQDTTLTLSCDTGYKFDGTPRAAGFSPDSYPTGTNLTLTGDRTATLDLTRFSDEYRITLTGNTVADTPAYTNNIPNTTVEFAGNVVTVRCVQGYKFDGTPYAVFQYNGYPTRQAFTLVDDYTATFDLSPYADYSNLTFTGKTVEDTPAGDTVPVNTSYKNCTGETPTTLPVTEQAVFNLKANEGFEFATPPTARYNSEQVISVVSADRQTATLTVDLPALYKRHGEQTLYVTGTGVAVVPFADKYGTLNLYAVTPTQLRALGRKRFTTVADTDIFDYVTAIRRVYVPVTSTPTTTVRIGPYIIEQDAGLLNNDVVTLDFGDVEITGHNGDVTDYDSDVQIFVPFIGFVNVPVAVIGRRLGLRYDVNIVSGKGAAFLSIDGITFYVGECTPYTEIAYQSHNMYNTFGDSDYNDKIAYGLRPFVRVVWYESKNHLYYNDDSGRGRIGDRQGTAKYVDVTEIADEQITYDEIDLIYRELANGITIL